MFSDYAQIASYIQPAREAVLSDYDPLPSYLRPNYQPPQSWNAAKAKIPPVEDFIMVAEFSELEGPKPVMTIPKEGGADFDQNAFAVRILAVDHQNSTEGFSISEDAQIVLSDVETGVFAFVHHLVLYDNTARGFVRPYCMAYISMDQKKLMYFYEELSWQFKKVARSLKYGNRMLFIGDLETHLKDLEHTKGYLLNQVSKMRLRDPDGFGGHTQDARKNAENELYRGLQTIRQSSTEIKEILTIMKPLLTDRRLEKRFRLLEERAFQRSSPSGQDKLSLQDHWFNDLSSLDELDMRCGSLSEPRMSPLALFKQREYKPVLVETKKAKRFNAPLRGLHELSSWGAKEGLKKLRHIHEYFKRDLAVLELEKNESKMLRPSCASIAHGQCITGNFLSGIHMKKLLDGQEELEQGWPIFQTPWGSFRSTDSLDSFKTVNSYSSLTGPYNASPSSYHNYDTHSGNAFQSAPSSPPDEFSLLQENEYYSDTDKNGSDDNHVADSSKVSFFLDQKTPTEMEKSSEYGTCTHSFESSKTLPAGSGEHIHNEGEAEEEKKSSSTPTAMKERDGILFLVSNLSLVSSLKPPDINSQNGGGAFNTPVSSTDKNQEIHHSNLQSDNDELVTDVLPQFPMPVYDSEDNNLRNGDQVIPKCQLENSCKKVGAKAIQSGVSGNYEIRNNTSNGGETCHQSGLSQRDIQTEDSVVEDNDATAFSASSSLSQHAKETGGVVNCQDQTSAHTEQFNGKTLKDTSCDDNPEAREDSRGINVTTHDENHRQRKMKRDSKLSALIELEDHLTAEKSRQLNISPASFNSEHLSGSSQNVSTEISAPHKTNITEQQESQAPSTESPEQNNSPSKAVTQPPFPHQIQCLRRPRVHKISQSGSANDESLHDTGVTSVASSYTEISMQDALSHSPDTRNESPFSKDHLACNSCDVSETVACYDDYVDISLSVSSRTWKPRHGVYTVGDWINNLTTGRPGHCLLEVLSSYQHLQHVIFSLLSGRPVLIIGSAKLESDVIRLVNALTVFVPGARRKRRSVLEWTSKPLRITDLTKLKLVGVCRPERRSIDSIIPGAVKKACTIVDIDKRQITAPPYQGQFVTMLLSKKKGLKSDIQLLSYIEWWLMDMFAKAFIFFHSFCLGSSGSILYSHSPKDQRDTYCPTIEGIMARLDVKDSDCEIIEYLTEMAKLSRIGAHIWQGVESGSIVHPVTVQHKICQIYRC